MDMIVRPHDLYVDARAFEASPLAADRIEVALFGPPSGEPFREDHSRAAA